MLFNKYSITAIKKYANQFYFGTTVAQKFAFRDPYLILEVSRDTTFQ